MDFEEINILEKNANTINKIIKNLDTEEKKILEKDMASIFEILNNLKEKERHRKEYKCPYCKNTNLIFSLPTRALFKCNPDGTVGQIISNPKNLDYIQVASDMPMNTNEKVQFICPECYSIFEAIWEEEGNYTVGRELT